jgi:alpha-tubulin suppressor-like RCC1 family protein
LTCWNFTACIDDKHNLYVWGALVSNTAQNNQTSSAKPTALCIKQPEQVSSLKVSSIQIGHSLAFAIEHKTHRPFIIGTNQAGELGLSKDDNDSKLIDCEARKTFIVQEALKERSVQLVGVGKSGFVLAIGKVIEEEEGQGDEDVSEREVEKVEKK